jgi:hypothetical protein
LNISGLIRNLLNDAQISEPKTLELKVGEVVKGMVLRLLSEQDAIINIGGVQVRAKLETPLKQGQVTLLQVQPDSSSGQILLKPLDASGVQIADDSLAEILKNIGLPDTPSSRQMIQTLHQSGISLSKDNVQVFAQLQSQVPNSISQEEWVPSAVVAFQKGIPVTAETVTAVRQAIAGPAFHETLQQLDTQMTKLLSDSTSLSTTSRTAIDAFKEVVAMVKEVSGQLVQPADLEGVDSSTRGLTLTKDIGLTQNGVLGSIRGAGDIQTNDQGNNNYKALGGSDAKPDHFASVPIQGRNDNREGLNEGAAAPRQGAFPTTKSPMMNSPLTGSTASEAAAEVLPAPQPTTGGQPAVVQTTVVGQTQQAVSNNSNAIPTAGPLITGEAPMPQQPINSTSGSTENGQQINSSTENNKTSNGSGSFVQPSGELPNRTDRQISTEARSASPSININESSDGEHWISRLIKAIGVEHENNIFKLPDKMVLDTALHSDGGILNSSDNQAPDAPIHDPLKSAETLKSALLQLVQADDIPTGLKETAQQAIQQITGQQLLLNSDRGSMFSNITMFVPIINAIGEQTAAIHIQSRKGPRGEIDVQNCRLVFDLRMKTIGDTMVDVQVVDRIVSLRILNDEPYIQQLLDSYREEISAGLSGIGYQFISLKCSPYPEKGQSLEDTSSSGSKQGSQLALQQLQALYGKKPYKGMDVRI